MNHLAQRSTHTRYAVSAPSPFAVRDVLLTLGLYLAKFSVCLVFALFVSSAELEAQPIQNPFNVTIPFRQNVNARNLFVPAAESLDSSKLLKVQMGHFVNAKGERVKLFGTLLSYGTCFPDSIQAIYLARRLHDLGMNCVRMRGWDYTWYLFNTGLNTTDTTFNADYIKRFDWFISQLKKQGIYVLLSQMAFLPKREDGVHQYDSITYSWLVQGFQYIDPDYQRAQKKFLRRLFNRVNPYTGLRYADEPTLALLTATDENSLSYYWNNDFLSSSAPMLPQYQLRYLDSLFSRYLRINLGVTSDEALKARWSYGPPDTANRVLDPGFEDLFTSPWQSNINSTNAQAAYISSDADKVEGSRSAVFKVLKGGSAAGDIQLLARGIKIEKGKQYTFKIWAKSPEAGRKIYVYLLRGSTPYTGYGLSASYALATGWKEYSTSFRSNSSDDNTLLIIQVGGYNSDVYIDKSSFREDSVVALRPGESIVSSVIGVRVANAPVSTKRILETGNFINLLQEQYYTMIRNFLRDSLKSKILVGGSVSNQNLNDVYTERNLDFSSSIGYRGAWAVAPSGSPWNNHWSVQKLLNVEDRYASNVASFARAKIKNKPTVVCGQFQIYPTPHLSELVSYLAPYAAYQDVDAFIVGDWNGSNNPVDLDSNWMTPQNIWEIKSQYTLQSFFPGVSALFSRNLVKPAVDAIAINFNTEQRMNIKWQQNGNYLLDNADQRMALFRRIEIDSFDAKVQTVLPHLVIPEFNSPSGLDMSNIQSDTKELQWNQTAGWMRVNTPQFISATGKLRSSIQSFDNISIEQLDSNAYLSYSWLSVDSLPITEAQTSLLTFATKAQNIGAQMEGDSSLWQGWGRGGVISSAARLRVSIRSDFDSLIVWPLDSLAQKKAVKIVATKSQSGKFSFELDQRQSPSLWYMVEQKRVVNAVSEQAAAGELRVFPNPVESQLSVRLPIESAEAELEISDALGRVIRRDHLVNGPIWTLDCRDLDGGLYALSIRVAERVFRGCFIQKR